MAPAVHWRVVDKIPDHETNTSILALVNLGSFDELLLDCCWQPPINHVPRSLVLVGCHDEACIVRTQARRKHASTPWPPCLHQRCACEHTVTSKFLFVHSDDVNESVQGLLLAWVGNFGDWRQTETNFLSILICVTRVANAPVVAITNCKDASLCPDLATHLLAVFFFLHLEALSRPAKTRSCESNCPHQDLCR